MTNLLPVAYKKRLARSQAHRFLLFGSAGCAVAAGVFALALLPAYFALEAERSALAEARASSASPSPERSERSEGAQVRIMLASLGTLPHATSSLHARVVSALSLRPSGVSVDRIVFGPDGGLILSGRASGRESIQAYRAALLSDTAHFSAVSVPVSSLLGTEGGRFTMTLSLTK